MDPAPRYIAWKTGTLIRTAPSATSALSATGAHRSSREHLPGRVAEVMQRETLSRNRVEAASRADGGTRPGSSTESQGGGKIGHGARVERGAVKPQVRRPQESTEPNER